MPKHSKIPWEVRNLPVDPNKFVASEIEDFISAFLEMIGASTEAIDKLRDQIVEISAVTASNQMSFAHALDSIISEIRNIKSLPIHVELPEIQIPPHPDIVVPEPHVTMSIADISDALHDLINTYKSVTSLPEREADIAERESVLRTQQKQIEDKARELASQISKNSQLVKKYVDATINRENILKSREEAINAAMAIISQERAVEVKEITDQAPSIPFSPDIEVVYDDENLISMVISDKFTLMVHRDEHMLITRLTTHDMTFHIHRDKNKLPQNITVERI